MKTTSHHESSAETAYLLRSPKNAAQLAESITEIKAGKAKKRKLIEPTTVITVSTATKRSKKAK